MQNYPFYKIEKKWQQTWKKNQVFQVHINTQQPKFYILDMFPYPSGAGLHVGHLLGYVATDIIARYKRHKGFNVLHPMGYDAFGLPAEQYAVQTGQHPATTTTNNIRHYQIQLQQLGLSFDWSRKICTTDPAYYRWTQWIFLQLFNSWYNKTQSKAQKIEELVHIFENNGNDAVQAACSDNVSCFTASEWKSMTASQKQQVLNSYRLAYLDYTTVNWCPDLGTVLANEEVKNGLSERGGYPVIQKKMQQWHLRITAYATRLLDDLDQNTLQWSSSAKDMQRNWIGKSTGMIIQFSICSPSKSIKLSIFTTRPETLFGTTYLAIAPEHPSSNDLIQPAQKEAVQQYLTAIQQKSSRERISTHQSKGIFTGSYALHPFTQEKIPIWIADYVLTTYGKGAVMGVPAHDSNDYSFATNYQLPIVQVIQSEKSVQELPHIDQQGTLMNAQFLNGLSVEQARKEIIAVIQEKSIGKLYTYYKLRDAIFSRQRYWGEPFPIYYKEDIPYALSESKLPVTLPDIDAYHPSPDGQSPLARAETWHTPEGYPLEQDTMPGWAGSSWYFLRYMDPHNTEQFVSKEAQKYWKSVDLYMGGTEHITGHLLYARFFTKFLYDLGHITIQEPFQKMRNQGMIQGTSYFVYRIIGTNQFVSYALRNQYATTPLYVDGKLVNNGELDRLAFQQWQPDFKNATFILENGRYICGSETEKMSKSKYNVINPADIIEQYGADTLRLYMMFLGPIEHSKPWDIKGIEGVYRFLKKLWALFYTATGTWRVNSTAPDVEEWKILYKTIQKVEKDIQRYAFNTAISTLMVCVNQLTQLSCSKKEILTPLILLLSPFSPHIAEELWACLGNKTAIAHVPFPIVNWDYLQEATIEYPVTINGKLRMKKSFSVTTTQDSIQEAVLADERILQWLKDRVPKKVIIVPKKIINIVV